MKPFSLEEYLKNPSRKVVTRDGRDVRIICTDVKSNGLYPIIALEEVTKDCDAEAAVALTKEGLLFRNEENPQDIFFASEKHEGWVNLYRFSLITQCGSVYESEEEAKNNISGEDYITTIKIEWEE